MEPIRFEVTETDGNMRLDRYLTEQFPDRSRSFFQKLIREECILLNEKPVRKNGTVIQSGDRIDVFFPEAETTEIVPEDIPLSILYEDQDLLIVNKPKDMVVHPAAGHSSGTLVNAVLAHCGSELSGINGEIRPGIVHRIDKDTTGALVICKNDEAHRKVAEQIAAHTVTRCYVGIVHGNIKEDEGVIDQPVGRSEKDRKKMAVNARNGRRAVTHYRVLERFGEYTYMEFRLETGRTHQIRVHMAFLRHPLLGDPVYGPSRCPVPGLCGQTLHARVIGLIHPSSGEYLEVEAPLPEYFQKLLEKLSVKQ